LYTLRYACSDVIRVGSHRGVTIDVHQSTHCLHNLLPSVKALEYSLHNSQAYSLPQCKYQLFKMSLLTDACLVTCKPYINFLLCILVFCIFPFFVLYCFYLRTSDAFINKIIVILVIVILTCKPSSVKVTSQ